MVSTRRDKTISCVRTMRRLAVLLYLVCSVYCTCPNGYKQLGNGDCYKTFTTPSSQRDAEAFCEREGGTLVQPINAFMNAVIQNEAHSLNANLWLGMTCSGDTTTSCTYSNGDSVTSTSFTNFHPGHPNPDVGNCVFLSISGPQHGKWVSGKCQESIGFGCQLSTTVPKCGSSYQELDDFCYKTLSTTTEKEGESFCEVECGHLASIHSQQENDFILSSSLPIGENQIRIGLEYTSDKDYQWTDGSISPQQNYSNFGWKDANFGSCVAMNLVDNGVAPGEWINTHCSDSLPSVCKRPLNKPCSSFVQPTTASPTFVPPTCSSTFNFTGNGTIYSPGYPAYYSKGLKCEFDITAPAGHVVLFALDTVKQFPDDASNISLYNSITDEVPFLPRLENGYLDYSFYASRTSSMKMSFSSGSSNEYKWSANYTSVDIHPSGCNQGVLQTPGMITSPNYNNTDVYRGYYPSQFNCTYQLAAPTGKNVRLIFYQFHTFNADDVLSIYNGPDANARLIGRYSFYYPPPNSLLPLTSTNNTMFLQFTPRSNRGYIGFSAKFIAV